MKKWILSLSLFALIFTAFAVDASAKDMSRRFGLGVDSSISKFATDGRGISAVYNINRYFGLQVIFGLNTIAAKIEAENAKFDTTITEWNFSLRALIPFVVSADVNLTAVIGFSGNGRASGFNTANNTAVNNQYIDGYQFAIDLGLRPEWFITEHFSIHTQVGLGITILTHSGSVPVAGIGETSEDVSFSTKASGAAVDFFSNADFLGMAGFTFWF